MTSAGARAAAMAQALMGTRFRLHGRDPAHGLDCVGVAALSLAAAGHRIVVPSGYALRGGDPGRVAALLDPVLARGGTDEPGALLLVRPGAGQLHLAVGVGGGVVHADAGLRRVVMRPGALAWPLVMAWAMGG